MILDIATASAISAAISVVLFVLFFTTYRTTRSRLSYCWTLALLFQFGGSLLFALAAQPGNPLAFLELPVGDVLVSIAIVWMWAGARSLSDRRAPRWAYVALPVIAVTTTVVQEAWGAPDAGAFIRFLFPFLVFTLSIRDILAADSRHERVKRPLLVASVLLAVYFGLRVVELVARGLDIPFLAVIANEGTGALIIALSLILVSFSISALSHSDAEERLRRRERGMALELGQGAEVQQALLPFQRLDSEGFSVAGFCAPSRSLSGDFFDWSADATGLVVSVADVMGKGVGAAMLGATMRAGLRSVRRGDPGEDVQEVVAVLGDDLVRTGSFATLFHAYLDTENDILTVVDAGHGLAVLVRADGTRERISSDDLPVGLNERREWTVRRYSMGAGDRLLVFSDGILDLFDGSLEAVESAVDLVVLAGSRSVHEAVDVLRAFADSRTREDDVTVVVVQRPALAGSLSRPS